MKTKACKHHHPAITMRFRRRINKSVWQRCFDHVIIAPETHRKINPVGMFPSTTTFQSRSPNSAIDYDAMVIYLFTSIQCKLIAHQHLLQWKTKQFVRIKVQRLQLYQKDEHILLVGLDWKCYVLLCEETLRQRLTRPRDRIHFQPSVAPI